MAKNSDNFEESPSGTQSVERALAILKEVTSRNAVGCTLYSLTESLKLNRTTIHRLVKCLCTQGAIQQDSESKKLFLGPFALALGAAAQQRMDLKEILSPAAGRIADITGDTCFVTLRSGNEAICIDRRLGSYPIKALVAEIGTRRPLGVGAGSLSILSAMSKLEIEQSVRENADLFPRYGRTYTAILKAVQASQRLGYVSAPVHGIERVIAIGLPIKDRQQNPIAALSITAIAERMTPPRRLELLALLRKEIAKLAKLISETEAQYRG